MNLSAALLSIFLVAQLPSIALGKSAAHVGSRDVPISEIHRSGNFDDLRARRNSWSGNDDDDDDILINQLSREYATSNLFNAAPACNNRNGDLESDTMNGLKRLFDIGCESELCGRKVLETVTEMLRSTRDRNLMRNNLHQLNDLFVPVRRRREFVQAPPEITHKLDPWSLSPARHETSRKHFHRLDTANPLASEDIEQIKRFMPIQGKRQKVIIPKPYTPFEMDPWLFQNINSDDRNMIDRHKDLNQLASEANKDITATAKSTTNEKFTPRGNNERMLDKTAMIFNPLSGADEFEERDLKLLKLT